jgi:hypothetical protein
MRPAPSALRLPVLLAVLAAPAYAQPEAPLLRIAQPNIGSNGFDTHWRGQDLQLAEDAWLVRVVLQTGSASPLIDEVRLVTAVPSPTTLRTITTFTVTAAAVEGRLPQPYLLRGGVRYTIWFHQNGTPRGTSGCDLTLVDPTWGAYHTNVDPTMAPAPNEPGYYWGYQYGTNLTLYGWDNLEVTGNLTVGGSAQLRLDVPPFDLAGLLFSGAPADQQVLGFQGPLRIDLTLLVLSTFLGNVGASGTWTNNLPIPNDPSLSGVSIYIQGFHDATFAASLTFSAMERLRIQ